MPKETKNIQGYWAQQYIWHSERDSQERRILLQKPPSKNTLFLAPDESGASTWPLGCDTPPPFSERFPRGEHAKWRCDTPPRQKGISAILARYPMKTKQMGAIPPSAILSRKGIARGGGYLTLGRSAKTYILRGIAEYCGTRYGRKEGEALLSETRDSAALC